MRLCTQKEQVGKLAMGSKTKTPVRTITRPPKTLWSTGSTALITGASSGIGAELAVQFAASGYNLILQGRDRQRLKDLAERISSQRNVGIKIVVKDLSRPGSAQELYDKVCRDGVPVDVLVNNAGVGLLGRFADTGWDREFGMLHLNVVSLVELTKLFLPGMVKRHAGRILNVASTAAFQPGPLMANYYAGKAYIVSFTVALAEELRGTGVTASVLCPGPTVTRFQEQAGTGNAPFMKLAFLSAQEVADRGIRGVMKGKLIIVPGFLNRLGTILVRFAPQRLSAWVVRHIQQSRP